jgi:hypothetical protein
VAHQRSGEPLELDQVRVTAQRGLLAAETDFVGARLTRQRALVQVYRALGGGGWQPVAMAQAQALRSAPEGN